jgi:crotonobetaine/carnitine-CoA ligase
MTADVRNSATDTSSPAPVEPDPTLVDPDYGLKQKIKMRVNSARLVANAVSGVSKFFLREAQKGSLRRTFRSLVRGEADDLSWAEALEAQARRIPDKHFLLYKDERHTYRQMDENANRVGHFLLQLGGGRGKGVGILMRNSPRYLDIFFGAQKIGMYSVTVNTELKGDGLAFVLNHSDVDYLVVDAELLELYGQVADRVQKKITVVVNDVEEEAAGFAIPQGRERLGRAYAEMPAGNPGLGYDKNDICLLMYTSGTTGEPKGVVYRYNKTTVRMMGLGAHVLLKEDDVFYTALSLAHGNALLTTTTMTLGVGATVALGRRFSASRFWDDVRRYDVTVFNTIGSILPILMKQPPSPLDRQHKVRAVNSAACPREMWEPFEQRFGVKLHEFYGAIDGGGKAIFNFGNAPVGSLGKISKAVKYRLVDEKGNDVPVGVPGELLFEARNKSSRVEYYKNEAASRKKSGDGWLHTGDLVKRDKNGFLYFVGRNTESMRKGGENVSAYEVEQSILKHPAVEEAAVYAVPSELAEDEIMAAVKLGEGQALEAGELHDFLSGELARFAVPRYIRFVESFPKTESHRVIKRVLEKEGVTGDTFDAKAAARA